MQKLNLPDCDLKITSEEGNQFVFDIIRKKNLLLTPEEWVRQHFLHLMINHLKYPKSLIKVESGLSYFKSGKRSDITLMKSDGKAFLVVECKAPDVKFGKDTLQQVAVYNKVLEAEYVAITNGLSHYIWKFASGTYTQLTQFPSFSH